MVILWLVLLVSLGVLLPLLILSIVAAVNAKTTRGRVAGIAGALAILLGIPVTILMLSLVAYRSTAETATVVEPMAATRTFQSVPSPPQESLSSVPSPPTVVRVPPPIVDPSTPLSQSGKSAIGDWRGSEMESFAANVYPSYRSAIVGVVNRLKSELLEWNFLSADSEQGPSKIVLTSSAENIVSDVHSLSELLRKQFPDSKVELVGDKELEIAEGELAIHVSTEAVITRQTEWDAEQRAENGFLRLTIRSKERETMVDGFVSEKPWVESFDRFVTAYPHRKFVVGYSRGLAASEGEARRDAMADAAQKASFEMQGNRYGIIDDRHAVDRFAQKLSKPYGDIWREAILVELPNAPQMDVARATVQEHFEQSMMMQMVRKLGVIFVLVAAVLICWGLNWITKGYYRTQFLVGLAGLVFVGGFVMMLFLA